MTRQLQNQWLSRCALALMIIAAAAACATNPATGKREFSLMSEAQEIQIGKEMDVEVRRQMGLYDDAGLQRYVEEIGTRLGATEPAVAFRRCRCASGQCVRASRRIHLPDPRHPSVPRQRGGAGGR